VWGGSWSPAGPKASPDAHYDAKSTFVAHPLVMVFGTIYVVFSIILCCLFDNASRAACYRFLYNFEHIF